MVGEPRALAGDVFRAPRASESRAPACALTSVSSLREESGALTVRHFTPRATAATRRKVGFVTARDLGVSRAVLLAKNPRETRVDDARARPHARSSDASFETAVPHPDATRVLDAHR